MIEIGKIYNNLTVISSLGNINLKGCIYECVCKLSLVLKKFVLKE